MPKIPDNYDLWRKHDIEQFKKLARRPKCWICGEYIQEDYYYNILGRHICAGCLEDFKVDIEED